MKLLLATFLLTGCVAVPKPASADVTYRIENLAQVVCSATAVGQHTLLTAGHCIKDDDKALTLDGTPTGILHIERDKKDHALVTVTKTFPAVAKRGPEPKIGDKVHWVGQPMGLSNVYGEGLIVGEYETRHLIDGNIWFGVSGSALFNERGEVVGVVSGFLGQQIYKLGFAWPLAFTDRQWAAIL